MIKFYSWIYLVLLKQINDINPIFIDCNIEGTFINYAKTHDTTKVLEECSHMVIW